MASIHEVAEIAGVSPTTVSMVLNNKSGVSISAATRERVIAAADSVGYRPNPYARALVGLKAPLVKLVYSPHEMYIGNLKAASLLDELRGTDREIMVTDGPAMGDQIESLLWGRPEAIVFQYVSFADSLAELYVALHEEGVHCIVADCYQLPDSQLPCDAASVDRAAGIALGVEHLVARGHHQIGLVCVESQYGRPEAYEQVLEHHGIAERYIARFPSPKAAPGRTRESVLAMAARGITEELLRDSPQITALMCGSDMIALGAIGAAAAAGRHIPTDLALVGFHGEPWTEMLPVPLTTVTEPVSEICALATTTLRARLAGSTEPWLRARVTPHLVMRQSTKEGPQCVEASP
jgi:LacI family transcriptional regulator